MVETRHCRVQGGARHKTAGSVLTGAGQRLHKLTRFSIGGYYLPVLDTTERRRRWCETPTNDLPWMLPQFFAVAAAVPVISPVASEDRRADNFCDTRPHCKAESPVPEVPSFLLVGAGLLLVRFPLRRRR